MTKFLQTPVLLISIICVNLFEVAKSQQQVLEIQMDDGTQALHLDEAASIIEPLQQSQSRSHSLLQTGVDKLRNGLISAADLFDEFTWKLKPSTTAKPRVGYGTFCGNDPTTPTYVRDSEGSSGDFSHGCPDSTGALGTPEGTDFDPDWPILDPTLPEEEEE